MESLASITILLLVVTIFLSYKGFRDLAFLERYFFNVSSILFHRDYKRLITSGFVHANWMHLLFNMVALFAFGAEVEKLTSMWLFPIIYFACLIAGNLLALYINRNLSDYTALGASGAVSGLIFFTIALFPSGQIGFMFLPFAVPAWLFGTLYMLVTMRGIRFRSGNIGHEAHLGGSIAGVIAAVLVFPQAAQQNFLIIALLLVLPGIFIYFLLTKPELLLVEKPFDKSKGVFNHEDKYNTSKRERERELDFLLDKISSKGIRSLSKKEKEKLDNFSR